MIPHGYDDFAYLSRKQKLTKKIGPFDINSVVEGDCLDLIPQLPDENIELALCGPNLNTARPPCRLTGANHPLFTASGQ